MRNEFGSLVLRHLVNQGGLFLVLKNVVTLTFILFLVLIIISNAMAHDMVHLAEYNLEGRVDLIQVTGSNPGSGAQRKLFINGEAQVEKCSYIIQQKGRLTVDDNQSWVTAVDSLTNLKVISAIELAAPPQIVFNTTRHVPVYEEQLEEDETDDEEEDEDDDGEDDDEEVYFDVIFTVEGNSRLAGVSIQVYADASLITVVGEPVFTDDDGVAVKRLPQGDYWFRASKAGFLCLEGSFVVTDEGIGDGSLDVDFIMISEDLRKHPQIDEAVQATFVFIGDKLESSFLTGTFKDADTGAVVSGVLSWSNGELAVAESGYFEWVFTPTDSSAYHVVGGVVLVYAKCRPAEKAELEAEILLAETKLATVTFSVDGRDVPRDELWVPESAWAAYRSAVEEAQIVYEDECAEQDDVDQAVANLCDAKVIFETQLSYGLLPETVTITRIEGVTVPVKGATPVKTIIESDQFIGAVTWTPTDEPFMPETEYTATITLTPKEGYTFNGVDENYFTVTGALSVTNRSDSGEVVAVFPATEAKTYAIGDIGPSGVGIVFYITDGGLHGLEAAPADWHGGDDPTKQWKNINSPTGGTLTGVGYGYANTYGHLTGIEHPAAATCRGYRSGFEGDWFLPSKDELNLLYQQKALVGGFGNYFYWSSSEVNYAYSWYQSFRTGNQGSYSKITGYTLRVRPVRAF
jgi:hypothetical protein